MDLPERPRLRSHLAAARADAAGRRYLVWDLLRLSDGQVELSAVERAWLELFDGSRGLREIQAEAMRLVGGELVPLEVFRGLAGRLDDALFLDSPRFRRVV